MKQVVIIPGGFHPYHAGHYALYQQAVKAFPGADVYVAATADTSTRPFPFPIKQKLAQLAGVPADRFVQVKSPFSASEITAGYDPNNTVLIFVRSEKDRNSVPQPAKRDAQGNLPLVTRGPRKGQPVSDFLQFYPGAEDAEPMSKHVYIDYLPTVEFGPGMTSATEIRNAWPKLNEKRKTALVMSLYPKTQTNPKLAANVVKMLDKAIGGELDEANDPKFVGFMNKAMANKVDTPTADQLASAPDWYKNAPTADFKSMPSHKKALKFGLAVLSKLDAETKHQLAAAGEQAICDYIQDVAERTGNYGRGNFVEEDIWECQDYLSNVFHDPSITSWVDVLQPGNTKGVAEEQLDELRLFHPADNPGNVDVYYRPVGQHSEQRRVVAKNIPYRGVELLTKAMAKKFGIEAKDLEIVPVDQPHGERLRENQGHEFILYINNKPAAKYTDLKQAEQDLYLIKSKVPTANFEIKKEVCNMVAVPVGLKEALLKEFAQDVAEGSKPARVDKLGKAPKPKNQQEYDAIEKYRKDLAQSYKPNKEQGLAEDYIDEKK